jgi:cytochrome P450
MAFVNGNANGIMNTLAGYLLPFTFLLFLLSFVRAKYNGLNKIPGPTLASFTKLWRLYDVWKGQAHWTAIDLHRKYGKLVRLAPNVVSVGDPNEIQKIYNIKGDYTKTGFYPIQCISWQGKAQMNLFSGRSEQEHREQRKKVANAYTMESLLKMEPAIDDCTKIFLGKMAEYADRDEPVDLGSWLQYYGIAPVFVNLNAC